MFHDFYSSFYYCILIAASVLCVIYFKKVAAPFQYVAILVVLTLCNELLAYFFAFTKNGNGIVYNLFTPVEYFLYAFIYAKFLGDKKWSIILNISVVLLIATEVLTSAIYYRSFMTTNSIIASCENILLVFLSLSLFIKIRGYDYYDNLLAEGVFWFNSAILLYYGYNVIFWSLFAQKQYQQIYGVNYLLSAILYIAYAFSVYLNKFAINKKV